jgi:hypothetical protein
VAHSKAHPGFAAVRAKIAARGYGKKAAGAILAAASRNASPAAKRANPRLEKVRGAKRMVSRVSRRGSSR